MSPSSVARLGTCKRAPPPLGARWLTKSATGASTDNAPSPWHTPVHPRPTRAFQRQTTPRPTLTFPHTPTYAHPTNFQPQTCAAPYPSNILQNFRGRLYTSESALVGSRWNLEYSRADTTTVIWAHNIRLTFACTSHNLPLHYHSPCARCQTSSGQPLLA